MLATTPRTAAAATARTRLWRQPKREGDSRPEPQPTPRAKPRSAAAINARAAQSSPVPAHTVIGPPAPTRSCGIRPMTVSYTHLRAHETRHDLVCRLLLEKKK